MIATVLIVSALVVTLWWAAFAAGQAWAARERDRQDQERALQVWNEIQRRIAEEQAARAKAQQMVGAGIRTRPRWDQPPGELNVTLAYFLAVQGRGLVLSVPGPKP